MLAAARKAAADASKAITLIESRAEALPSDVGKFDVVTIGQYLQPSAKHATASAV